MERLARQGAGGREEGTRTAWPPGVQVDNIRRFRTAVGGALAYLEARRQEINDLNVFPVADGDTGDNMALTLRAVVEELERLERQAVEGAVTELDRRQLVESVARAALLGARGNSGVILSQLIRGAAEELSSRPGELIDPALLGAAMLNAANRAYESVREPAEGTILTVAREMAHQLVADVAHHALDLKLPPDASVADQDAVIAAALERALGVGEEAVKRGPQLLSVLREAGVVDAGAVGLLVILAGVIAALRGEEPDPVKAPPVKASMPHHSSSTYRYCTNFVVSGSGLEPERFIPPLEELGDSVLVVGDATTLRVHVHTDHPEQATALFADHGKVFNVDIADMHRQIEARTVRLAGRLCGAVAVVDGEGFVELYRELGVEPLVGGPTLNPSTYDLLAAIHQLEVGQVVVLPCSPNVLLAAEQAAALSEKEVVVLPALSQQAGVAAAVAFNGELPLEANREAILAALEGLSEGSVGAAAADDPSGRFRAGEAVGLLGEEVVAGGSPHQALLETARAVGAGKELLTVYVGADPPFPAAEVAQLLERLEAEVEVRTGGQSRWWWLLAGE